MMIKRSLLPLLMAAAIALAGCADSKRLAPQGEEPIAQNPPAAQAPAESQVIVLYYSDWQAQHVVPEARHISSQISEEKLPTEIVTELLKGPTDPHLVRVLPENLTLVRDVYRMGQTIYVDLSKELLELQGSASWMMAMDSIAFTLSELSGVAGVHLMVEGSNHGMEISGPFYRDLRPWAAFPNLERVEYLQAQVDQGKETWRKDARETLRWEGRMFGFNQVELGTATIEIDGNRAVATVERTPPFQGRIYAVVLSRQSDDGIWYISSFETVKD